MIFFFGNPASRIYAVKSSQNFSNDTLERLHWLFAGHQINEMSIKGPFVGPRASMITPWSTNAVEITQNMGIDHIERIESFAKVKPEDSFDPMLLQKYETLDQQIFDISIDPEPILEVENIAAYNKEEGLSLSEDEVSYLEELAKRLGRNLTDSEVFGFSQVNSEHCRHKIFNGQFIIDGEEQPQSLFQMIKATSQTNPNDIVSAYKDNVAFVKGPVVQQFAPAKPDVPSIYQTKDFESVISLKAETHNFPTTVEPFNGAATGSGGEIRDRLAGGRGSIPMAGTAVYMTSYPRLDDSRSWEEKIAARPWLYQTPLDILIKASNGASDFGNKFGQPLIAGSLLTFEHEEDGQITAFDKVIMLAGGIGYGKLAYSGKDTPSKGDQIVVLGGENYRIGMGGAAVSSADTGAFGSGIELNAVQRSNPEMQKRAANTIQALVESDHNPIVSIHDHGAGGHLNCLSELVEETGGVIDMDRLPVGDPTLSAKELIGNESQERMGLIIHPDDIALVERIAARERAPMYEVGRVTGDQRFTFASSSSGTKPMDLALSDMFGSSPKTIMQDETISRTFEEVAYESEKVLSYLADVLRLESVACKDWLTNKVDRCVGGRVAKQQCAGALQLPLNNCGVMALDFKGQDGIATSIGHAPVSSLIDAGEGAKIAVVKSLSNIVWAPLQKGLQSVSLSANWMWPCNNKGEDARLYIAVKSLSQFAIDLGVNVPTGKDSLSMAQKYADKTVLAPGTVIVSAAGHCKDVRKVVEPVLDPDGGAIFYLALSDLDFALGGSAFGQTRNLIGSQIPSVLAPEEIQTTFNVLQEAIVNESILAGHDIGSGGLITTLLEMCFPETASSMMLDLSALGSDLVAILFSEAPGMVVQDTLEGDLKRLLEAREVQYFEIGSPFKGNQMGLTFHGAYYCLNVDWYRDVWYHTSYLLDTHQTKPVLAKERYSNYKSQPLRFRFPDEWQGKRRPTDSKLRPRAAILREKGSNSEREMANALYEAGFEVRDVHMTDIINGRETLEDIQFLGAVGGFSNSDVLGSARGWAGAIKYNERARQVITAFFEREDTMSVGICNGCQLFLELDLINPNDERPSRMTYNDSGKHESAFTSVTIRESASIMLAPLQGCTLGVWISHGEGKFLLPEPEDTYEIAATYAYTGYPSNPNGSDYNCAMLASKDGRHLATMPHIERSFYPWNWANYPKGHKDEVSPWSRAFSAAYDWVIKKNPTEE